MSDGARDARRGEESYDEALGEGGALDEERGESASEPVPSDRYELLASGVAGGALQQELTAVAADMLGAFETATGEFMGGAGPGVIAQIRAQRDYAEQLMGTARALIVRIRSEAPHEVDAAVEAFERRATASVTLEALWVGSGTRRGSRVGEAAEGRVQQAFEGLERAAEAAAALQDSRSAVQARDIALGLRGEAQLALRHRLSHTSARDFFTRPSVVNDFDRMVIDVGVDMDVWYALTHLHAGDAIRDTEAARDEQSMEIRGLTEAQQGRIDQLVAVASAGVYVASNGGSPDWEPLRALYGQGADMRQSFLEALDRAGDYDALGTYAPEILDPLRIGTSFEADVVEDRRGLDATARAIAEVATDAVLLIPGAVCHALGGFYDGLASWAERLHIPGLPDVFRLAGSSFAELGDEAHRALAGDMPPELLELSNRIASTTGEIEARLLEAAVNRRMTGLGALNQAADAGNALAQAHQLASTLSGLRRGVETAFRRYHRVMSIGELMHQRGTALLALAVEHGVPLSEDHIQSWVQGTFQAASAVLVDDVLTWQAPAEASTTDTERAAAQDRRELATAAALDQSGMAPAMRDLNAAIASGDSGRIQAAQERVTGAQAEFDRHYERTHRELERSATRTDREDIAAAGLDVHQRANAALAAVGRALMETLRAALRTVIDTFVEWGRTGADSPDLVGAIEAIGKAGVEQVWKLTVDELVELLGNSLRRWLQRSGSASADAAAVALPILLDVIADELGDDWRDAFYDAHIKPFFTDLGQAAQDQLNGLLGV